MNKYPVHKISRLRMGSDGKGIRTLVLMHGCNLRCKYCINPQTTDEEYEYQMMTPEELYSKISIDRPYLIATNGGITFGGGEPLLYPGMINEIREICDPDMTIYVETSLHVPWDNLEESVKAIDGYYVDIKTVDPELYKNYTSKELSLSFNNLKRLLSIIGPEKIIVRIPEIRGMVDKTIQIEEKNQLKELGVTRFDLFKYIIN